MVNNVRVDDWTAELAITVNNASVTERVPKATIYQHQVHNPILTLRGGAISLS